MKEKIQSSEVNAAKQNVEYLDLGNLGVERIKKLDNCQQLSTLILRGNNLDFIDNLEHCSQLWNLDLSYNRLHHLDGLCRFVAFGLLDLSCNKLQWNALIHLKHIHILELHLFGNENLEKDKHYRFHVIDCLPNVWMLDGKLITSFERLQVEQFFQKSALSRCPVRHKLSRDAFVPSEIKQIQTKGIFSHRADQMFRNFPRNAVPNVELDRRRMHYLVNNVQSDILNHLNRMRLEQKFGDDFLPLEEFKKVFSENRYHARSLLLLLLTSLEFSLPTELIDELLNGIGRSSLELNVLLLLTLPTGMRVRVICLLFNMFKVERDAGSDGSLSSSLYLSLHASLTSYLQQSSSHVSQSASHKSANRPSNNSRSYQHILAEFVSILLPYSSFLDYIRSDPDVGHLLVSALGDEKVLEEIEQTINNLSEHGVDKLQIYQTLINEVLMRIRAGFSSPINNTRTARSKDDINLLTISNALPRKPVPDALFVTEFHMAGKACPNRRPMNIKLGKPLQRSFITPAKLGDNILLGPQTIGKLVAKPDPETFLVHSESIPDPTGAMAYRTKDNNQHYVYISLSDLEWDTVNEFWRPKGTVGDKLTVHQADQAGQTQPEKEILRAIPLAEMTTPRSRTASSPSALARMALPPSSDTAETFTPLTLDMKSKTSASMTSNLHPHQNGDAAVTSLPTSQTHANNLPTSSRPMMSPRSLAGNIRNDDELISRLSRSRSPTNHDISNVQNNNARPPTSGSRPHSCPLCEDPEISEQQNHAASNPNVPSNPNTGRTVTVDMSSIKNINENDEKNINTDINGDQNVSSNMETDFVQHVEANTGSNNENITDMNGTTNEEEQTTGDNQPNRVHYQLDLQVKEQQADLQNSSRAVTSRSYRGSVLRPQAKMQPVNLRRTAALSATGCKVVIAQSHSGPYQQKHNGQWKNEIVRDGTPPQRPSSPSAKSCDGENVTVLPVKYVNRWLGAGRNLHKEAEAQRPSTDHKPGWLIDRPQTMGSLLHTSRTVHTCQHLHRQVTDVDNKNEKPGVRPTFHSAPVMSRGFVGNSLTPTADQLAKARLGRQKAFMCEECRQRDMVRQVALFEQLFGIDNEDDYYDSWI